MDNTTAPRPTAPRNGEVATKIGLTISGISRIRSGARFPSLATMANIEREYGWTRQAQCEARDNGTYAVEFETVIATNDDAS